MSGYWRCWRYPSRRMKRKLNVLVRPPRWFGAPQLTENSPYSKPATNEKANSIWWVWSGNFPFLCKTQRVINQDKIRYRAFWKISLSTRLVLRSRRTMSVVLTVITHLLRRKSQREGGLMMLQFQFSYVQIGSWPPVPRMLSVSWDRRDELQLSLVAGTTCWPRQ